MQGQEQLAPLHAACSESDVHMVLERLRAGDDVNACIELKDRAWSGGTPLVLASQAGHVGIVRVLLEHRAAVNLPMVSRIPVPSSIYVSGLLLCTCLLCVFVALLP
jgi:ankyrin repeat protein